MYNLIHKEWNKFLTYLHKLFKRSKEYINSRYGCIPITDVGVILVDNKICHLLISDKLNVPNYLWSEEYNCSFSFKYNSDHDNFEYGIVFNRTAWNNRYREFILRHELGHILLGHVDKSFDYELTKKERTKQDFEADEYTMKTLKLSTDETINILNYIIPKTVHDVPTNLHDRIRHLREYKEIPMV